MVLLLSIVLPKIAGLLPVSSGFGMWGNSVKYLILKVLCALLRFSEIFGMAEVLKLPGRKNSYFRKKYFFWLVGWLSVIQFRKFPHFFPIFSPFGNEFLLNKINRLCVLEYAVKVRWKTTRKTTKYPHFFGWYWL